MIENSVTFISDKVSAALQTIVSVLKVLVRSKFGLKLPEATTPKCYILGNGPSLKQSIEKRHAELVDSSVSLFVVNSFAVSPLFVELKPKYYVFLDPYFASYNGVSTPIDAVKKTYEHLLNDVSWEMTLFLPARASKNLFLQQLVKQNPNIKISFYNYVVFDGLNEVKFQFFKRNLAMPQCQNILGACIFIATNMQFKEVFLLGADHSWHEQIALDENNNLVTIDKHFYNQQGKSIVMNTHANNTAEYGVHSFFASLAKAFFSYKVLAKYAKYRGVKVKNWSEKSYIDAFERI
ncbi:hypothetical protein [Solitalea lacus]|uniref:hypothetical protein n=1 Tax=Solitalea lacus TaxID=2911172 RepID=UPI001EDC1A9F|nr:hypothetical protein [Solitalea lacus]UKJ08055.1 hypothetical protein L2B55_02535 [Solitalea lacus]